MNKYFITHLFILLLLFSQLARVQHAVDHVVNDNCCDSLLLSDKIEQAFSIDDHINESDQDHECSLCLLIGYTGCGYYTDSVSNNLPLQSFHTNEDIKIVSKHSFSISSRGPPTFHI